MNQSFLPSSIRVNIFRKYVPNLTTMGFELQGQRKQGSRVTTRPPGRPTHTLEIIDRTHSTVVKLSAGGEVEDRVSNLNKV